MNYIQKPDWLLFRRASRGVGYSLLGVAGVAAMLWPPLAIRQTLEPRGVLFYLWAVMLAGGSFAAAVSHLRGRWTGEYMGLWAVIAALCSFGIANMFNGRGLSSVAGACLLFGVAAQLLTRWMEVALLRRDMAKARQDNP